MANEQGFRVPDVVRFAGITYRQLDYWARTGLITPSIREAGGSGTQRVYSFEDLLRLKVIKSMLDGGMSLAKVRRAVAHMRHLDLSLTGTTLLTTKDRVYAVESDEALIDLLKGGQTAFVLPMDPVRSDLEDLIRKGARTGRAATTGGA